jgi:hypothetical protein
LLFPVLHIGAQQVIAQAVIGREYQLVAAECGQERRYVVVGINHHRHPGLEVAALWHP